MIQLKNTQLAANVESKLKQYQSDFEKKYISYPEQVNKADDYFNQKKRNKPFKEVKRVLREMCYGPERCMYCEDSEGNAIEHFKPKSLYPKSLFSWENYLYVCSACNTYKGNKFFITADSVLIDVTRKKKDVELTPPLEGSSGLINPRYEDPLDLLKLDLVETFTFRGKVSDKNTLSNQRALETVKILGLNRSALCRARKARYRDYIAHLEKYISCKQKGKSPVDLNEIISDVKDSGHPTVWAEMKRHYREYHTSNPEHRVVKQLTELFSAAPEALNW